MHVQLAIIALAVPTASVLQRPRDSNAWNASSTLERQAEFYKKTGRSSSRAALSMRVTPDGEAQPYENGNEAATNIHEDKSFDEVPMEARLVGTPADKDTSRRLMRQAASRALPAAEEEAISTGMVQQHDTGEEAINSALADKSFDKVAKEARSVGINTTGCTGTPADKHVLQMLLQSAPWLAPSAVDEQEIRESLETFEVLNPVLAPKETSCRQAGMLDFTRSTCQAAGTAYLATIGKPFKQFHARDAGFAPGCSVLVNEQPYPKPQWVGVVQWNTRNPDQVHGWGA